MPDKPSLSKWADIIPTGAVVIICGIGAITVLFQSLVVACAVGIVGIAIGVATLRMDVEKTDKLLATIGMILALVPVIYAIVIFVKR
jgi:hypothetical protein